MEIVFWDWNGTLVNDAPVLCDSFNRILVNRGVSPISLERYREMYRHPIHSMYQEAGVDLIQHPFEQIAEEWHEHYCEHASAIRLHHDSLDVLRTLQGRGTRQMVLSALPRQLLVKLVRSHAVEDFFEQVTGIDDNRADTKVHEGVALVRRLGIKGSDVTIIGDSSHDVDVARELKANCILVARGAESRARLEPHGYPVLDSFADIIGPATS